MLIIFDEGWINARSSWLWLHSKTGVTLPQFVSKARVLTMRLSRSVNVDLSIRRPLDKVSRDIKINIATFSLALKFFCTIDVKIITQTTFRSVISNWNLGFEVAKMQFYFSEGKNFPLVFSWSGQILENVCSCPVIRFQLF